MGIFKKRTSPGLNLTSCSRWPRQSYGHTVRKHLHPIFKVYNAVQAGTNVHSFLPQRAYVLVGTAISVTYFHDFLLGLRWNFLGS